jgi:hypothetical protein
MSVRDRAALAIARMDQTRREMAERRSLRERNSRELLARTAKAMREQVPGMIEAAKQAAAVAQHREKAGGWATTSTDRDRSHVMGFGIDEENAGGYRPPAAQPGRTAFVPGQDDERPAGQAPPSAPPAPAAAPAPAAPPVRAARARPPDELDLDDEDDFSNQSSWLRNR